MTEQNRIEETLREADRQKDEFLAVLSHELRNSLGAHPLGTLLFAAAALERDDIRTDVAKSQKITTTIKANAERLSWLVQNLQRVTRLTGSLAVPNEQNVDVGIIAKEVPRQLEDMAVSRQVRIVVELQLPELCADPVHLCRNFDKRIGFCRVAVLDCIRDEVHQRQLETGGTARINANASFGSTTMALASLKRTGRRFVTASSGHTRTWIPSWQLAVPVWGWQSRRIACRQWAARSSVNPTLAKAAVSP